MLEIKPYADKDAYAMYVRMVIQVDTHNVQLEALLDVLHGLGEHIIESDGATDYRYLPLVLISGDFMIKDGILCATDYDVIKNDINAYLPNYIGDYSVFADIKVPKDGKIFIQTDFGLYTKVFIRARR